MKKHVLVNIQPQIITTSKGLDTYSPEKRQCFLYNEKKIKFFKIYTQSNCQLECLTNFTITICDCVHFSMPRSNDSSVCASDKWGCVREARKLFSRKMLEENLKPQICDLNDSDNEFTCDCLPSCTSIEYDTELSYDDYPYNRINNALNVTNDSQ